MSVERGDHVANWFQAGGQNYARFRPEYPPALAAFLAQAAPDTRLAVDVGCGSGQLTAQLGAHFDAVLGLDPSVDQIAHAPVSERVRYAQAAAEHLRSEEHTSELQSRRDLVCRLLLEKKKKHAYTDGLRRGTRVG